MAMRKTNKALLSALTITCGLLTSQADAGIVNVVNTANSNITTRVIPGSSDEGSTYCWSCFSSCLRSDLCRKKKLFISPEGTGTNNFTIVGTEGGILFTGTCSNLSTYKNYEVVFFDTSLGIGCKSTEI
jgi:hypothetical protein